MRGELVTGKNRIKQLPGILQQIPQVDEHVEAEKVVVFLWLPDSLLAPRFDGTGKDGSHQLAPGLVIGQVVGPQVAPQSATAEGGTDPAAIPGDQILADQLAQLGLLRRLGPVGKPAREHATQDTVAGFDDLCQLGHGGA